MLIIGKYHVTATEKKHIKQIIANGWTQGGTKRKFYKMEKTDFGFSGIINTYEKDDWGRPITRKQSFTVTL